MAIKFLKNLFFPKWPALYPPLKFFSKEGGLFREELFFDLRIP